MRAYQPGQSPLLLLDVVEILRREDVDYVVIGAFALSVHGTIRASVDADALLKISPARLKKLRDVFDETGLTVELRQGDAGDPIPAMIALSDPHGNRVDLLGGLRGMDPDAFSRAMDIPFLGQTLRFVGREDLIAMKCFAGGPQDLLDAESAYRGGAHPVDIDLIRRIVFRFGRDATEKLERILEVK